jgi:hypothetical protein
MSLALLHRSLRLFGLDVFIEGTGPQWGLFDFDHVGHGKGVHEAWGPAVRQGR